MLLLRILALCKSWFCTFVSDVDFGLYDLFLLMLSVKFFRISQFHTWNLGSVFLLAIGEIIIVVSLYCFPYFFVIFVIYLEYYNCNLYHTASFTAFFWVFLEVYATFDSFIGSILVSLYHHYPLIIIIMPEWRNSYMEIGERVYLRNE